MFFLVSGQILRSPLSKIVLVVWCFAVLVLVQSYVANLSSMLAAEASANNGSSSAAGSAPHSAKLLWSLRRHWMYLGTHAANKPH
jgi:hypothetical protein